MNGTILKRNKDDSIHLIGTSNGWLLEETSTGNIIDETDDYNKKDKWIDEYGLNRNVGQFWYKEDKISNGYKRNSNVINHIFSRVEGETWTDKYGDTWMYKEGTPDQELDYDVNADLPERATFRAYKMFRTEYNPDDPSTYQYKGMLFPLYINANSGYKIGVWYKAGKGAFRILVDENGEPILDSSGNPTCKTIEKNLAYRPGLHMGSLPLMRHRGRQDYPHKGNKDFDYFHSQEVFAEVEYAGNYDYTEKSQERRRNSAHPKDPYEAGFYDTTDFENGYYKFKTNVHASDDEAWLIADAMKIIRVIPDDEVERIIAESGTTLKPQIRGEPNGKDGDMFMADFTQFEIQSARKIKSDVVLKKGQHGWEAWQTNKLLAKVPGFSNKSKQEVMKHIPGYENVIESRAIKSGALDWIDREREYILDLGRTFAKTKKPGIRYTSKIDDGGASYNLFFDDDVILYIHYGIDLRVGVVIRNKGRKDVEMTHNLSKDCDIIEKTLNKLGSVKSSKQIQSRFYQNGGDNLYTLSEAAQYLASLFFDLRTIHFLSTGSEFYTYHKLAQELYEQTEEYYDDLVETAIGYDSDVSPMYVLPGDWDFVDENDSLDTTGQVPQTLILDRLQQLYDVLENVQSYDSMVQSKIDSMLEYYDKEIYKLRQALK